jgi:hypothetical protein
MIDDETRELFHRMDVRLERLDTKIDNLGKTVADVRSELRTRFEGLENRLNSEAGNWVVTFWGKIRASGSNPLAILIGAAFALTKWW